MADITLRVFRRNSPRNKETLKTPCSRPGMRLVFSAQAQSGPQLLVFYAQAIAVSVNSWCFMLRHCGERQLLVFCAQAIAVSVNSWCFMLRYRASVNPWSFALRHGSERQLRVFYAQVQ